MTTKQIIKQVAIATIEAEGCARKCSELETKFVRNGQGVMSQRTFAEQQARRLAA